MKRIVYLLLLFPVLFASCGSEQQDQEILFKNFSIQEEPLNWKKVFTNKYEITPLETTSDCLVGMIDKIKKLSGHYYIASGKKASKFTMPLIFLSYVKSRSTLPSTNSDGWTTRIFCW